ncbi:hypothetical protein [Streptomyces sp. cmx-4-9]|uniref:hypothetical protein n=1 Tax=Streptomyces sp. cmx-4-9 TaxID=2790941 RepID=UPI00397EE183
MARAQTVVGVLTAALLCTGLGVLRVSEGAAPATRVTDDALPSQALGLSGHRRLVRQLEQSDPGAPGMPGPPPASGPVRSVAEPLGAARPLRLRIPALAIDVPLSDGRRGTSRHTGRSARWDAAGPAPGAAGTAVVTGSRLRLSALRRGFTIEVPRADHRTAVFTVVRVSPGRSGGRGERLGRAQLRLVGGETAVLARLTGERGLH